MEVARVLPDRSFAGVGESGERAELADYSCEAGAGRLASAGR